MASSDDSKEKGVAGGGVDDSEQVTAKEATAMESNAPTRGDLAEVKGNRRRTKGRPASKVKGNSDPGQNSEKVKMKAKEGREGIKKIAQTETPWVSSQSTSVESEHNNANVEMGSSLVPWLPSTSHQQEYSFMSTPASLVGSSPVADTIPPLQPQLFSPSLPVLPSLLPTLLFNSLSQFYFNANAGSNLPFGMLGPHQLNSTPPSHTPPPVHLMMPSPPPSPPAPTSSSKMATSKFAEKMDKLKLLLKVRECSVRLVRLTPEEIEKHCRRRQVIQRSSPGKQLHLLRQSQGRGRPRNDRNDQCMVAAASESMMQLKIVKMEKGQKVDSQTQSASLPRVTTTDAELKALATAAAASVVDTGIFDQALTKKCPKPRKRSRKVLMTPRRDHAATDYICHSKYFQFSSRSLPGAVPASGKRIKLPQTKKVEEKTRRKAYVSVVAPPGSSRPGQDTSSSSSGSLLEPFAVAEKKSSGDDAKDKTDSKNANGGTAVDTVVATTEDDGINWMSEFLNTAFANDEMAQALNDCYMPDVSMIQGLTEDLSDILGNTPDAPVDLPTNNLCPDANIVSSSTRNSGTVAPEDDDDIVILEEISRQVNPRSSPRFSSASHQRFRYYEDLYNNDILLINAEDEDLPLP